MCVNLLQVLSLSFLHWSLLGNMTGRICANNILVPPFSVMVFL